MRGGRNKFGPMYKYDRALRQQALRQRQMLLTQGYHQPLDCDDFMTHPSGTPPDVKPDISQLSAASSRMLQEPSPTIVDASCGGEFYQHGSERSRVVMASACSYPARPPQVCQDPYTPSQHHGYSYGGSSRSLSVPFCGVTNTHISPVTPLAGLSHMMNDVPNFVGQSTTNPRLSRNFPPPAVQSRMYTGQPPSRPPVPPYHLPVVHPPEELRRRHSSALPPPSSFQTVLPPVTSSFMPHRPAQLSQVTFSSSEPLSSSSWMRLSQCVGDVRPSTLQTSPIVAAYSSAAVPMSGPPPAAVTSPRPLSEFIVELRRNEPNQREVQKKLSDVLLATVEEQRRRLQPCVVDSSPQSAGASEQLQQPMELICKVCDQMLFMMVEWARGARFFRELKVCPDSHALSRTCTGVAGLLTALYAQLFFAVLWISGNLALCFELP